MPAGNNNDNDDDRLLAWLRHTLRPQEAVWTPQCPTPEMLLAWMEKANTHPQAAFLNAHFFACDYCQEHYAKLHALQRLAKNRKPDSVSLLAGLKDRISELTARGILAPMKALLAPFEQMRSLTPVLRSEANLYDLRPRMTAVRSPQPTLQWKSDAIAQELEVVIARPDGHAWTGRAQVGQPFVVPIVAGLEPGGVYQWQVIAYNDEPFRGELEEENQPSAVAFVVLEEALVQQVAKQEQEAGDSLLARISVYETHGLYEEARQAIETIPPANRDDTLIRIYDNLLRHFGS